MCRMDPIGGQQAEEGHRHTKNALQAISGRHMGLPEVLAGPQVRYLSPLYRLPALPEQLRCGTTSWRH